jgi:hypothetical protein
VIRERPRRASDASNEQPGWPHAYDLHWVTANPECPGDEFHNALHGTPREELWDRFPEFRNKSILLAGDSVGRHLAETLCGDYFQVRLENEDVPGWKTHYGWTSTCVQPDLGLTVAMIHIYGMANTSDPAVNAVLDKTYVGADWDLQSRVGRWWNTTLKGFTPDYVQLNSGAWEYRVSRREGGLTPVLVHPGHARGCGARRHARGGPRDQRGGRGAEPRLFPLALAPRQDVVHAHVDDERGRPPAQDCA